MPAPLTTVRLAQTAATAAFAKAAGHDLRIPDAMPRGCQTLIRHDIYMAEMISAFGTQIERKFGKALIDLREKLFSPQQMALLHANMPRTAIKRAARKPARSS